MTAPCCGCTLQTGTKIIAILEIIGSVLMFILSTIGIIALTAGDETLIEPSKKSAAIAAVVILMIISIVSLGLGILLLQGTNTGDVKKMKIWIVVEMILLTLSFVVTIYQIAFVSSANAVNLVGFILQLYFLFVVYSHKRQLENSSSIHNGA